MAKREFSTEKLKLRRIYEGPFYKNCSEPAIKCRKVDDIYGPLLFPRMPPNRSYTYGSFVMSVDGRIAFSELPDGTLIAKKNELDPSGGECDFWMLNLLRAVSDAVVMGSRTLAGEPYLSGRIFDPDLASCRSKAHKPGMPIHVVVTRSGRNLPLSHKVFRDKDIPALIAASPEGAAVIWKQFPGKLRSIDLNGLSKNELMSALKEDMEKPLLFSCGTGSGLDPRELLMFLKEGGCNKTLIESPSFLSHLMAEGLLDEMFLTTSGLFIGGNALTLGENGVEFTPEHHPHTRVVTIHEHSDSFFYTRYKIDYSKQPGE